MEGKNSLQSFLFSINLRTDKTIVDVIFLDLQDNGNIGFRPCCLVVLSSILVGGGMGQGKRTFATPLKDACPPAPLLTSKISSGARTKALSPLNQFSPPP